MLFRALVLTAALLAACTCPGPDDGDGGTGGGSGGGGGRAGGAGGAGGGIMPRSDAGWCGLPGARVRDTNGTYHQVSGGLGQNLSFLKMPPGFCARWFGNVGNSRQMRFAPGGELFVASPTTGTTSGGPMGQAAIFVLPDDDGDGYADGKLTWRSNLASTQGLLFHDGGFWYQDHTQIMREPYAPGDRAPTGTPTQVADITVYTSGGHWPKTLDVSDDGTIFITNGGDEGEQCISPHPFHGGVLALDGTAPGGAREIAKGMRNPIYVRCHRDGHNWCFANELARDYSTNVGGREKLIPLREGDDWGFPCCASKDLAYADVCFTCSGSTETMGASSAMCQGQSKCSPKCDTVVSDTVSFLIGDTPFGLDFIDGQFPAPWSDRVYIAPHGAFGTWTGARVVAVALDTSTGLPLPGSNAGGMDGGAMRDFLTGWDDSTRSHGRPTDVTVSPDGRLFVSNDQTGDIIWVAPVLP